MTITVTYSQDPALYKTGKKITNNIPSGGSFSVWAISPPLPSGLVFNTSTGVISGTPTSVTSDILYSVTADSGAGEGTLTIQVIKGKKKKKQPNNRLPILVGSDYNLRQSCFKKTAKSHIPGSCF